MQYTHPTIKVMTSYRSEICGSTSVYKTLQSFSQPHSTPELLGQRLEGICAVLAFTFRVPGLPSSSHEPDLWTSKQCCMEITVLSAFLLNSCSLVTQNWKCLEKTFMPSSKLNSFLNRSLWAHGFCVESFLCRTLVHGLWVETEFILLFGVEDLLCISLHSYSRFSTGYSERLALWKTSLCCMLLHCTLLEVVMYPFSHFCNTTTLSLSVEPALLMMTTSLWAAGEQGPCLLFRL